MQDKTRYTVTCLGDVAQLGERSVRIREVEGSIPFVSTKQNIEQAWPAFFMSILRFLL